MGYKRADNILPAPLVELIQRYVDGENIYIPRKSGERCCWGESTSARREFDARNESIFKEYCAGIRVKELSEKYFLTEKSIWRIIKSVKDK